jgi:hypothetical protein
MCVMSMRVVCSVGCVEYLKESEMKSNVILILVLSFNIALGILAVRYINECSKNMPEVCTVASVVATADWNDQFNAPGWTVFKTTEGETVLKIHGSSDGYVWFYPNNSSCPLTLVLKELKVKITKIICCHPAVVKERSNVDVSFFQETHRSFVYATLNIVEGENVRVYNKNPN